MKTRRENILPNKNQPIRIFFRTLCAKLLKLFFKESKRVTPPIVEKQKCFCIKNELIEMLLNTDVNHYT